MPYLLDPLADARWPELLASHPDASVFHSRPWLAALRETYGYQPVALTSSAPGQALRNGLVFCRVSSWITGRRWVSLPFSDHAAPLLQDPSELQPLLREAESQWADERLRYIELRPMRPLVDDVLPGYRRSAFVLHNLDLSPSLDTLFRNLHADSIQRKIRRAERENLTYSEGSSAAHLDAFYRLLQRTRRRHAIPPQPMAWFGNLVRGFGAQLKIHLVSLEGQPIASILTLQDKSTLTYKYGCSDETHHNVGGMQLAMWRAIEGAKRQGLASLDLGRSDVGNSGLITYKDRWGAARTQLIYYRKSAAPPGPAELDASGGWKQRAAGVVFSRLPERINTLAGRVLYRHLG